MAREERETSFLMEGGGSSLRILQLLMALELAIGTRTQSPVLLEGAGEGGVLVFEIFPTIGGMF